MHGMRYWCFAACHTFVLAAPPVQIPLRNDGKALADVDKKRPLHGRFLHVTDFHPDRFYQVYSSTSEEAACHRGQGPAGIYGAETSECDSPIELINQTMHWIGQELKDKIDFVVWTGDSARHDNDDEIPRNANQVFGLNELMVQKMYEVFGKHGGDEEDENPNDDFVVPIVPNLGNNDILPHNVMSKGPNTWTRTYARVWRQFIPEAQKHQFEQGGWFYVEVIPNKLAVFSLNTLYFFKNNAAVDGCASQKEPGYQQMEWLRIQLQFMRDRGVKAILTGHVPPVRQESKTAWEETCWQKYTLWLRQYRDVIVGSLYGHFNYDHFMLQDFKDLDKDTKHGLMQYYHTEDQEEVPDEELHPLVSPNYFIELREQYSELPEPPKSMKRLEAEGGIGGTDDLHSELAAQKSKKSRKDKKKQRRKEAKFLKKMGGQYAERFAASFVSASVVPNLYPTLRIFEYNITGLDHNSPDSILVPTLPDINVPDYEEDRAARKKPEKKYKFKVPEAPSKSSPPGPAYSPQSLSLLKYTQYYANITRINNDFSTASDNDVDAGDAGDALKWNEGKHKGKRPHDKDHQPQPKKFKYQVYYDTQDDEVYKLQDLTVPSLVDLARRIGHFTPEEDVVSKAAEQRQVVGSGRGQPLAGASGSEPGDDAGIDLKKKHKKKHGKGKHGSKHRKQNEAWYTFIRRAFVETMDPEEIEEHFGH